MTSECLICKRKITEFGKYSKHMARHLKQLALVSLPGMEGDVKKELYKEPSAGDWGGHSSTTNKVRRIRASDRIPVSC